MTTAATTGSDAERLQSAGFVLMSFTAGAVLVPFHCMTVFKVLKELVISSANPLVFVDHPKLYQPRSTVVLVCLHESKASTVAQIVGFYSPLRYLLPNSISHT